MRHCKLINVCATFKQYLLLQLFHLSLQAELILANTMENDPLASFLCKTADTCKSSY